MHIPPFYKRESWQRFLAGTFVGAILAFFVFVYMYGQLYEGWVEENLELRAQLQEIKSNYKALEENNKQLDQRYQQRTTVSSIEITILNQKQLDLDDLIIREFEEIIKLEINEAIGKEVDDLSKNYSFLIRTLENKIYRIHNFSYQANVQHLFIKETLEVHIKLNLAN
ncbi:sporulation membrane protein YtrI [Paraliobacillus sp. JSM ZJ581]|uniref:sporulation membrane protein YtrI n=1 Tax=Paraliobacillus sp. JSM ZJ581 TaxID=3342118 RepID=UPI0035A8BA3D